MTVARFVGTGSSLIRNSKAVKTHCQVKKFLHYFFYTNNHSINQQLSKLQSNNYTNIFTDSLWTCRGSLGNRAAYFGNHWPRLFSFSCYFTVLYTTRMSCANDKFLGSNKWLWSMRMKKPTNSNSSWWTQHKFWYRTPVPRRFPPDASRTIPLYIQIWRIRILQGFLRWVLGHSLAADSYSVGQKKFQLLWYPNGHSVYKRHNSWLYPKRTKSTSLKDKVNDI
jgi:hypothetical protein